MNQNKMNKLYDETFSLPRVVEALICYRCRLAGERRRIEFEQMFSAPFTRRYADFDAKGMEGLFPARRRWKRSYRKVDRRSRDVSLQQSLRLTLRPYLANGGERLASCEWGKNLLAFTERVRKRSRHPETGFSAYRKVLIHKPGGQPRELHVCDDLEEKVFLKLLARYLKTNLDPLLSADVLAFREEVRDPRTVAVQRLHTLPKEQAWVGEVDIRGFFDRIPHGEVREALMAARLELDGNLSGFALDWVETYLCSHAREGRPGDPAARGIPQGLALSPILANLVLRKADQAVRRLHPESGELLYLRYCDDVIFVSGCRQSCRHAMDRYIAAIGEMGLEAHGLTNLKPFEEAYRTAKTKGPYFWGEAPMNGLGNPWVSFLGYEIRRNGDVSVRPASIDRFQQKQENDMHRLLRLCRQGTAADGGLLIHLFTLHQLHQSLGRFRDDDLQTRQPCWRNAFPLLTDNPATRQHFRDLDRGMMRRKAYFADQIHQILLHERRPPGMRLTYKFRFHPRSTFGYAHSFMASLAAERPHRHNPSYVKDSITSPLISYLFQKTDGYGL